MATLTYRQNVCMLLFNAELKLLLGERQGEAGIWQFPQGGVEDGITLEENVLRELNEELGIAPAHLAVIKKLDSTHTYDWDVPPAYAKDKWRGQTQTFWLVEFRGKDSEIRLDLHQQEFNSWRWCTAAEVRTLAEPKRLPGYEAPLREFEEWVRGRKVGRGG